MAYPGSPLKIVASIEARMNASRLPGKMILPLAGEPVIARVVERVRPSRYVDEVMVASTVNPLDDLIAYACRNINCKCFRGSENDVMGRVIEAVKSVNGGLIVEINGDCPVIDYRLLDQAIEAYFSGEYDYVSNITALGSGYPDGFDVQVFSLAVLEEVAAETNDPIDRTHVSYPIYSQPERFKCHTIQAPSELTWSELELLLDEKDDYIFLDSIYRELVHKDALFSAEDVVNLLRQKPELLSIVQNVKRKAIEEG
jgi:spore coat polysaccharide biosynthesis protein SpsF